jgi:hypothetical protein
VERAVTAAPVWEERLNAAPSSTSPQPDSRRISLTELGRLVEPCVEPVEGGGEAEGGVVAAGGLSERIAMPRHCLSLLKQRSTTLRPL